MKNILIIDDNNFDLKTMARVVRDAGYQVITAESGDNCLSLLGEHAIDLLITDMVMPGQDGLQTIALVRQQYPDLPIIAMSGAKTVANSADADNVIAVSGTQILHRFPKDYEEQLNQLKLAYFIRKPCKAESLVRILDEVLPE